MGGFLLRKYVRGKVSQRIRPVLVLAANAPRVVKKKGVPLKVRLTGVVVGVLGERTIKPGTPDEVEGEGVSLLPRGPFNWLWPWVALVCL
jgi:hypothetical protein